MFVLTVAAEVDVVIVVAVQAIFFYYYKGNLINI